MKGKTDHGLSVTPDEFLYFVSKPIYQFFNLGCHLILWHPHAFHNTNKHMFWKEQIDEQDIEVVGTKKTTGNA